MAILIVAYIIISVIQNRRASKINVNKNINSRRRNVFYFFYVLCKNTPVLRKVFNKILNNTASVYPADQMSINKEATKTMLKSMLLVCISFGVTVIFANDDIWYLMFGLMASLVIFHMDITSKFQKKELELLNQMDPFFSEVRRNYTRCPIVEDAVEDTLDVIPYEIGLHISKIHEILVSPIMEEKTEEYTSTSPNRFLLLLLSICTTSKEYSGGDDGFLNSLSTLKEEVNFEKRKQDAIRWSYFALRGICLCIVFLMKPIELWANTYLPDLKDFYGGTNGRIVMVAIFLLSFICYYLIEALRDSRRGDLVTQSIWLKISGLPYISTLFNKIVNKNYMKAIRINEDLKEVGDMTGPKAFYIKQCVFAIVTFILINTSVFITTVQQKITMLNDYVAEFDSNIVPNDRYIAVMQETSKQYVFKLKNTEVSDIDRDDLVRDLQQNGNIKNATYAQAVADEVIDELTKYHNTYFKFYTIILSALAAVIAFQIPRWYLLFKIRLSGMNKEEEVSQFQTIILILMNADGIGMDEILEWMEKFAFSFKSTIQDCIINLESGQQEALEKMKMTESNLNFQHFVDCLLAIDDSDIKSAFSELTIDRDHAMKEREQKTDQMTQNRANIASVLAFVPFFALLFGYLIFPILTLVSKMYALMDITIN